MIRKQELILAGLGIAGQALIFMVARHTILDLQEQYKKLYGAAKMNQKVVQEFMKYTPPELHAKIHADLAFDFATQEFFHDHDLARSRNQQGL